MGEGCLSVNRDVEGIVPRYARVTVEGYDTDGNKIRIRAREEEWVTIMIHLSSLARLLNILKFHFLFLYLNFLLVHLLVSLKDYMKDFLL